MRPGGPGRELPQPLRSYLHGLVVADFYRFLPPAGHSAPATVGGSAYPHLLALFTTAAIGQRYLAQGRVIKARYALGRAVTLLPPSFCRPPQPDGVSRVRRPTTAAFSEDDPVETVVLMEVAGVLWRDQTEVDDLSRRAEMMEARDALPEALAEQLSWADFAGPHLRAARGAREPRDIVPVSRQRQGLCDRATHLRHAGDPTAGSVSPATWDRMGGYDGVLAEALDRLADRPGPTPWWGTAGTGHIPVRPGRLRVWEHARQIRRDLDPD